MALLDSSQVSGGGSVNRLPTIVVVSSFVLATGCSSLAQVPRGEFAAVPVRKNVLVRTIEGEQYAFDRAVISADTLTGIGYRQHTIVLDDGQPSIEEIATEVHLSLDRVASLQEKRRDWGRTTRWGVGAAGAAAFVIAVGTRTLNGDAPTPGGGKGGGPEL
jgi:hypothetical protein